MGYKDSLEKAGAVVHNYEEFGSYQGDWLAFVTYNGERGIVQGSYGSCSGCDSFQAEFDCDEEPTHQDGVFYRRGRTWDEDDVCTEEEYDEALSLFDKRLADFGRDYLEPMYDKQHYINRLAIINSKSTDDYSFDDEEKEYCEWAILQDWDNKPTKD